jgi:hypothetical protein
MSRASGRTFLSLGVCGNFELRLLEDKVFRERWVFEENLCPRQSIGSEVPKLARPEVWSREELQRLQSRWNKPIMKAWDE